MGSETTALRRFLARFAGFFPLIGALTGFVWIPLLTGDVRGEGLGVIGNRFLSALGKPIGIVVLVQSLYTALQSILWLRYQPFYRPGAIRPPGYNPSGPVPLGDPEVERAASATTLVRMFR